MRYTEDFNGAQFEGVGVYQITTKNGRRASTARSYLHPVLKRHNLHLETRAHVTRLLFEGNKASGVEYQQNGKTHQVRAGREVILSGGAVNSPQLLQLSGVGPAALLRAHGVEVVVDSPAVGQNLQDHIGTSHYYKTRLRTLNGEFAGWRGKLWAGLRYALTRGGPLSLGVNQGGGFVKSSPDLTQPNLQLYYVPASYSTAKVGTRPMVELDPFEAFLLGYNACRPSSRGEITIRSADPFEHPAIRPNYLATEHDRQEAIAGAKLMRKIAASPAFADIITEEFKPGVQTASDDDFLEDFRQRATTIFHPSCTCRMGENNKTNVVDSTLKVHGVDNLRVIDASIFPNITSGNTNAPSIMVGEKGADLVLADT